MRTTLTLQDDVVAEVDRLRRERGLGLSEAVNLLVRAGMTHLANPGPKPFVQRSFNLGTTVDLSDVGEVLDLLDGD